MRHRGMRLPARGGDPPYRQRHGWPRYREQSIRERLCQRLVMALGYRARIALLRTPDSGESQVFDGGRLAAFPHQVQLQCVVHEGRKRDAALCRANRSIVSSGRIRVRAIGRPPVLVLLSASYPHASPKRETETGTPSPEPVPASKSKAHASPKRETETGTGYWLRASGDRLSTASRGGFYVPWIIARFHVEKFQYAPFVAVERRYGRRHRSSERQAGRNRRHHRYRSVVASDRTAIHRGS